MAFNVLIVDDSSAMRSVIKKTIKASGFNVGEYWEASDGAQALKVLEQEWVDLVLTDINMPNMSGIDLINAIKDDEMLQMIPVVMVTTEGSKRSIEECMAAGAKGYIKKPFMPEEIKRSLEQIMGVSADGSRSDETDDDGGDF